MPPVQLVSVNELAGDENENCQARWSAAVNEWRTELGEAGTTGRYGKVREKLNATLEGVSKASAVSPSMRGSTNTHTHIHTQTHPVPAI